MAFRLEIMPRSRKGVQFQHRGSNAGRRASVSESDGVSEPSSPTRYSGINGKLKTSKEEVLLVSREEGKC